MPIHLYRVRLTQCSCVDISSLDLVIHGCTLYGSSSSRMSTRRLPVITLCFSFRVHIISCFVLLGVSMVPRRFVINLRLQAYHDWMTFFKIFSLLSSSCHLHRLSINITARDLLGLWCSLIILLHLIFVLYVSLLPFFRWLPVRLG